MPDLFHKLASFWGPEVRVSYGSFTTANTAAPTILEQRGAAVTRTAAGRFQVAGVSGCKYQQLHVSQAGTTAQIATERLAGRSPSTGVSEISVVTAGGSTEADTTGLTVNWVLVQRMSN